MVIFEDMRVAVNFNNQLEFAANEINNITINTKLPVELIAVKLFTSKYFTPENGLSLGTIFTEFSG